MSKLGKRGCTKSDEFLEKFQMAFDTPPPHFWKIITDMVAYMQGGMMARYYENSSDFVA